MASTLFIGGIPYRSTEDGIRAHLEQAGVEVVSVKIILDRETGRSRGFGFADVDDDDAAEKIISMLNGKEFEGRPLVIKKALPKQER